ncbi:endo-1,4-beta-xylanase [Candidatus Sumerlaeota bacterium]|nr:endo-1,4-beta-xylanase [Candidatus Sumerlaeota bacterium]
MAVLEHRTGILTIHARPRAKVRVRQMRHEFGFGAAVSNDAFNGRMNSGDLWMYRKTLRRNFNSAVHENALKWYSTERRQGEARYDLADRILDWCEANNLTMRGHCIFWAKERFTPKWVQALDDETLLRTLETRAKDVLARYRGRIGEYDVNNEMTHGRFFADRLGDDVRLKMFQWCREADPSAVLYVNDYSILNGGSLEKYDKQIEELLAAGAPVGGIGVQGHFGERVDVAKVRRALDRLARFGLPIEITEFDMKTLDEKAKARGLRDLYRTAFAHPAVEGILMWGFWQNAHWLSSKSFGLEGYTALWRADWTPTPAAEAYRDLVFDDWWTDTTVRADRDGVARVRVFFGEHEIESAGQRATAWVRRAESKDNAIVDLLGGTR